MATTKEIMTMLKEGYAKDASYAEMIAHNETSRIKAAELTKRRIAEGKASSMELLRSGYQKALDDVMEAESKAKMEREAQAAQAQAQGAKARADEQAAQVLALQESKLQQINKLMAEIEASRAEGGIKNGNN